MRIELKFGVIDICLGLLGYVWLEVVQEKKIKENNFLFMFDCILDNIKEN